MISSRAPGRCAGRMRVRDVYRWPVDEIACAPLENLAVFQRDLHRPMRNQENLVEVGHRIIEFHAFSHNAEYGQALAVGRLKQRDREGRGSVIIDRVARMVVMNVNMLCRLFAISGRMVIWPITWRARRPSQHKATNGIVRRWPKHLGSVRD